VEIIGRLFMMATLMSIACIVGVLCLLVVLLLLRLKKRQCRAALLIAALFPPVTTAYWLGCLIVSSLFSGLVGTPDLVFGDINERLPNGYRLTALDKMPEAGRIEKAGDSVAGIAWVRSLQVEGPYVFGNYDYTYFPRTPEDVGRDYFLFDTRSGLTTNFATEDQLASVVKKTPHLTATESFHAPKSAGQRILTAVFLFTTVVPPLVIGVWLLFRLIGLLRSSRTPLAVDG
jgi:hypothetical protein